jgi:phospholipid N-methyltransferase
MARGRGCCGSGFWSGYIVPSSPFLIRQTAKFIDFSAARTVVELGPGEGCHTRGIARRMRPDSKLVLIELDHHFAEHLKMQFAHDYRVSVIHANALQLPEMLQRLGISEPDYIISGLPFTIMERGLRERLLARIALAMGPKSRFITYQASLQISENECFDLVRREHCMLNVPPLHVIELRKSSAAAAGNLEP